LYFVVGVLDYETSESIDCIIIPSDEFRIVVHEFVQEDGGCAIGASDFNEASWHSTYGRDAVREEH
jgi:hypothetical protein